MKKALISLMIAGFLAGCGVDGAPIKPEPKAKTGLTFSGQVSVGVSGTL